MIVIFVLSLVNVFPSNVRVEMCMYVYILDHDGYTIETGKTSGMKELVPCFNHSPAKDSLKLHIYEQKG